MFRWLRQSDIPARLAKQYEATFNLGKMAENEIKLPAVNLFMLSFMMGRNTTHAQALKDCVSELQKIFEFLTRSLMSYDKVTRTVPNIMQEEMH